VYRTGNVIMKISDEKGSAFQRTNVGTSAQTKENGESLPITYDPAKTQTPYHTKAVEVEQKRKRKRCICYSTVQLTSRLNKRFATGQTGYIPEVLTLWGAHQGGC
jgi:hypothetical protein